MNIFRSIVILGSMVLTSLAGCSNAAREASKSNSAPVVQNITLTANTSPVVVGIPLFASYTYFDTDNDAEATSSSSIQWRRDGATISGATGRLYTLTLADAGKTISAEVTPLAQTGSSPGLPVVSNAVTVAPVNPANVVLTVSSGLKQLHFSWLAVTGATYYRVLYNPDGVSGFVPVSSTSSNLTATTYDWDIGVHRINWPKAQFMLEACDSSGCLPSASISAVNIMLGAIGYVKASNTGAGDYFGYSVALSADGNTLAVGAWQEDSAAIGNPLDDCGATSPANCAADSGAVYVYTRSATTTWSQQAYVKASNTGASDGFGRSVALSANGNTLAIGAWGEDSAMTGVTPGAPTDAFTLNDAESSGAVYVYARSATTWSQQAYVKASNTQAIDYFGISVALSADGNTLAVGASGEGSKATGIGGDQSYNCIDPSPPPPPFPFPPLPQPPLPLPPLANCADSSGAVYVYIRSATTWSQQAYVKASNTEAGDNFGNPVALSADGNTLAVGAYDEGSTNIGVTPGAPTEASTPNGPRYSGAVYVYTRSAATWSQQAYVKASNTGVYDNFGHAVALSADGNTLAVGAFGEDGAKSGVTSGAPDEASTGNGSSTIFNTGAVYVYTRNATIWTQQAYVKASNTGADDGFGISVALSADGNTLAIGAFLEDSAETGVIRGAPVETATPDGLNSVNSGAVYVYTRSAATWSQQAYVKALDTGASDEFGRSVALSADGNTLAVGTNREDSNTTDINSTPNELATDAGAVYLY